MLTLSVYRTLSLRYLVRRWTRAILIVLSIAADSARTDIAVDHYLVKPITPGQLLASLKKSFAAHEK